ncbi:hypothetical protein [Streptomyces sp. NPDC127084]|uniref:hypothetical protein n=1 Tax=Streptomyces sp. NPDC127084 TaxID=3347133 RepID=UPI00365C3BF3
MAFDHPETRATWKRTRRRVMGRFWLWTLLFVALFALSTVVTAQTDYAGRGGNQAGPAIGALAFLWYPFVLYTCLGALSRLKQARSALQAFPWQQLPAARKASGPEAKGVAVHLALGAGTDGEVRWSPTMCARDPRRWNRWDDRLEQGAWFAGDPTKWGVLALPGGEGIMTVQRSTANHSTERTTAKQDRERVLAAAPHI